MQYSNVLILDFMQTRILVAKPNYAFAKRQKEIAKKKKKEAKKLQKLGAGGSAVEETQVTPDGDDRPLER